MTTFEIRMLWLAGIVTIAVIAIALAAALERLRAAGWSAESGGAAAKQRGDGRQIGDEAVHLGATRLVVGGAENGGRMHGRQHATCER